MSYDAPHLLLLDEPTNHLDIDAREALVQALNNYEGAVVLVSHDPSMVERVANRLWLINDSACSIFDGDLEDYRKFIVRSRREERKDRKAKKSAPEKGKNSSSALKKKAEEVEKNVIRLTKEKEQIEDMMADADFYHDPVQVKKTQQAYDVILKDLQHQEALWLEAQEACEKATG